MVLAVIATIWWSLILVGAGTSDSSYYYEEY